MRRIPRAAVAALALLVILGLTACGIIIPRDPYATRPATEGSSDTEERPGTETEPGDKPVEDIRKDLAYNFRAPGHVHLLNTSERILENRHGHTELCTALMYMAGVKPSATICEMMGDDGGSMHKEDVRKYADAQGITMITGSDVQEAWAKWKEAHGPEQ